jgi:hypothetical protein
MAASISAKWHGVINGGNGGGSNQIGGSVMAKWRKWNK